MLKKIAKASNSKGRPRAWVVLALGLLILPCVSSAQTRDAGADKRMLAAYAKRSKSCAPKSPLETELSFATPPRPGGTTPLIFRVMAMEAGPKAVVSFDLPRQMVLRGGSLSQTGALQTKKAYEFDIDVAVLGTGHFEVHASVIAGEPEYRFGRRETLYIDNDGTNIVVSTTKPVKVHEKDPATLMASGSGAVITNNPVDPKWGPVPMTPVSDILTDPNGAPLDGGNDGHEAQHGPAAHAPFANVTVSGYFRYRHDDNTLHGAYGTQVFFWDDDTFSGDDLMAQAVCADNGFFTATFDNNDPEAGTTDLYLEFKSNNGAVNVHSSSGTSATYSAGTGLIANNIPNGSYNVGSWYIDQGTAGTADANERAYEVCDYMSRAWAYGNYNLGYDTHFTNIRWFDGSTDGTYYDPSTNSIHLAELNFSSPDVLMHEFGHDIMDSAYGENWVPGAGGSHSFTGHYNQALAWTEGWATWYSCSAQGNDWTYNDNNPSNLIVFNCDSNWDGNGAANGNSDNLSNSPNFGYNTESAVLSFLLDLDDSRNSPTDPYDWTSLGDNEIWDVTRYYNPAGSDLNVYGIQEFFDGWSIRGWAYRPQLNGEMHVHGMNQGIGKPFLGISSGVSRVSGTWYYGGYGRGSYYVKNYGSINYNLNRCYVWLRGPAGEDIGQFGADYNSDPIAPGDERLVWEWSDQTGYNPANPNFVYGNYTITAGHYRSDGVWQVLLAAESGTTNQITVNVIRDTDAPDYCNAVDDGDVVNSQSSLHVYATADDYDSSIKSYWTRVGTTQWGGDEQDWVEHPANNQTSFDYNITGLSLNANTTYYITVVARNIEGYDTWASTDGIIAWDATAPGAVTVTDDGAWTSDLTQLHVTATSSETDGAIIGYWTRVGTSPGSGNEQDWVFNPTGDVDVFDQTITGLSLTLGETYYVTIVARNKSNLDTFGYSDGIRALVPKVLSVNSVNPNSGVNITVTSDLDSLGVGTTGFTRHYETGAVIGVSNVAGVAGKLLDHIELDGTPHTGPITMDADHTLTAVFVNAWHLSVQSTNPNAGVPIRVWNLDHFNRGDGNTAFDRLYKDGKVVALTAPASSAAGNYFDRWMVDGVAVATRTISVTMNMAHTVRAVYVTGKTLTVNSTNPGSGVPITVWVLDKLGQGSGSTSFNRLYAAGAGVGLTAPRTIGSNGYFQRWDLNGAPWLATPSVNVPMFQNQTVNAVYATGQIMTVDASQPAVPITVYQVDKAGLANGNTSFTRLYATGTVTSYNAPATAGGKAFLRWELDGSAVGGASRTISVTMNAAHTIRAVYAP